MTELDAQIAARLVDVNDALSAIRRYDGERGPAIDLLIERGYDPEYARSTVDAVFAFLSHLSSDNRHRLPLVFIDGRVAHVASMRATIEDSSFDLTTRIEIEALVQR